MELDPCDVYSVSSTYGSLALNVFLLEFTVYFIVCLVWTLVKLTTCVAFFFLRLLGWSSSWLWECLQHIWGIGVGPLWLFFFSTVFMGRWCLDVCSILQFLWHLRGLVLYIQHLWGV